MNFDAVILEAMYQLMQLLAQKQESRRRWLMMMSVRVFHLHVPERW